jgi:hypothetical protein
MVHRSTRFRRGVALLIGSLLILVMATPVLADHLTAPTIGITQNSAGTLVRGKTAGVMVSGTVTCDGDGWVSVWGYVTQPNRRGTTRANGSTEVYCSVPAGELTGSAAWVVTVRPDQGKLVRGDAYLSIGAYNYVEERSEPCDNHANDDWCYEGGDGFYHYDMNEAFADGPLTIN